MDPEAIKDMPPSRVDVENLKQNWCEDPCWDIEDTEGFEAYRDELIAFRDEMTAKWDAEREARNAKERQRVEGYAKELGCTPELVRYIESLERRIRELENNDAIVF